MKIMLQIDFMHNRERKPKTFGKRKSAKTNRSRQGGKELSKGATSHASPSCGVLT